MMSVFLITLQGRIFYYHLFEFYLFQLISMNFINPSQICTTPSERYNHAAVMYNDGCMYVYGGYSQRCEDYCGDMWFFDIYLQVGIIIYYYYCQYYYNYCCHYYYRYYNYYYNCNYYHYCNYYFFSSIHIYRQVLFL